MLGTIRYWPDGGVAFRLLAFERYFNEFGPADANDVHSLSKSVLSVVTGIAIDNGLLRLDTPISELLPA